MLVLAIALLAVGAIFVGPALSDGPPLHPHLLVTGLEVDEGGEPVGWKKCRELANGQSLPLNAHHEHLHTGRAGEAQMQAGNAVVPGPPLTPWSTCDELAEAFLGE